MPITYAQAQGNSQAKLNELNNAINSREPQAVIMRLRGRYIAALQAQLKAAKRENLTPFVTTVQNQILSELRTHRVMINQATTNNKHGNYSVIKEFNLGFKSLVNSIKIANNTTDTNGKIDAGKNIIKSIGTNLKNVIKAPLVVTTRILSNNIVGKILFAPIALAGGILHAAWHCLDAKPSKYDGSKIINMSNGFTNVMTNIKSKIQTM